VLFDRRNRVQVDGFEAEQCLKSWDKLEIPQVVVTQDVDQEVENMQPVLLSGLQFRLARPQNLRPGFMQAGWACPLRNTASSGMIRGWTWSLG